MSTPLDQDRELYFFDIVALTIAPPLLSAPATISSINTATLPHLSKNQIDMVMTLHERMNHPSSSVMARAIRDRAWTGIPDEITATLVERVFINQPCLSCCLGKVHHWTPGPGTGAPYPYIGYAVSIDYVPVSIPAYGGFTAQFIVRELSIGYILVFLVKQKTEFVTVAQKIRSYFLQFKSALRIIYTDAGLVEMSESTRHQLALIHVAIHSAPPEQQNQNPVERTVQTLNYGISTMLAAQKFLPNEAWGLAAISYAATANATPNRLSGDSSPMFLLTGRHPHLPTMFKFSFGQPVVCPRLKQDPLRSQFRYGPYGELGFAVGSDPSATGAIRVYFPDRKRKSVFIRLEASPVKLFRRPHPGSLINNTVTIDSDGQLVFSPPTLSSDDSTPLQDQLSIHSPELESSDQTPTEISFDQLTSNLIDDNVSPVIHIPVQGPNPGERKLDIPVTVVSSTEQSTINALQISEFSTPCWYCTAVNTQSDHVLKNCTFMNSEPKPAIPIVSSVSTLQSLPLITEEISDTILPPLQSAPLPSTPSFVRYLMSLITPSVIEEPTDDNPTYKKARNGPDYTRCWAPAVETEMSTHRERQTGTEVPIEDVPPGTPIYPTKFDLKTKRDMDTGHILSFKARLCVQGDAFDTFKSMYSPTVRFASLMLLLNLAVHLGLILCGADVEGAFLYPLLDAATPVFIALPLAYTGHRVIWKLNKTLYGLPHSPEAFYRDVSSHLIANGYERTMADPCLFFRRTTENLIIIISIHVDDFAIAASNQSLVDETLRVLQSKYKLKTFESLEAYIGIHLTHNADGSVTLTQPAMIRQIFNDYKCKPNKVRVPIPADFNDAYQDDSPPIDSQSYLRLLGRLMYIVRTRPDIAYAISRLSTRSQRPTEKDFASLIRVLVYLNHTINLGLRFHKSSHDSSVPRRLFCFVDAAYATHMDSKSHSGYSFGMDNEAGMFFSRSTKQTGVTLSSTEAENWAAVEATKEIIWFRDLLAELGFPQTEPTTIYADNTSMITLAQSFSGNHSKVKHFMLRINFLIDKVRQGVIQFVHVDTSKNVADILTKPLGPADFERLRPLLLGME